jgi:mannose-6-phosphate isomerase-like protein (cupin superfamily)
LKVFYVISGVVQASIHEHEYTLHAGSVFYVPKNNAFSLANPQVRLIHANFWECL